MLIEMENYIIENFRKNQSKLRKLLFPLKKIPPYTDKEIIDLMNKGQEHIYIEFKSTGFGRNHFYYFAKGKI